MKTLLCSIMLVVSAGTAHAGCNTYGTYTTCSDGTTYNRLGNTVYGSNSRTGNTWSQTQIGNSTYGQASDGSSWQSHQFGNYRYGTDSRGNSWSCIGNVCN
jgi:hypothetical protein